jgi:hypothetical protein
LHCLSSLHSIWPNYTIWLRFSSNFVPWVTHSYFLVFHSILPAHLILFDMLSFVVVIYIFPISLQNNVLLFLIQ